MHNGRIAVLMPTRFRSAGLGRAYESWRKHSEASDIVFGFQEDDPHLDENRAIVGDARAMLFGNVGLAAKVNALCEATPGYAGYMVLNDDQVIHTPGWDRILLGTIDAWQAERGHRLVIPHWRDGLHDRKLPQGFVTDALLEATGSYYPRGYMRHLFTDNYFLVLGQMCDLLSYVPQVFIEHLHLANGKAPMDANYAETQSKAAYDRDREAFERWRREDGFRVTEAIRARIEAA
jgi:hypothetical protein